jgi:hypothetical protein
MHRKIRCKTNGMAKETKNACGLLLCRANHHLLQGGFGLRGKQSKSPAMNRHGVEIEAYHEDGSRLEGNFEGGGRIDDDGLAEQLGEV